MTSFKKAAVEVLTKANRPLHYKEITHLAVEYGFLKTNGATPEQTMYATIFNDIKSNKNKSPFIQTAPAKFSLNNEQNLINFSYISKITDYHAKYFAYELTKRCSSDSLEKLTASLADAQVDLNPHQVDAALFAFRSPLSNGAILADEVGLGKTIEAGILISQKWAERKRKILVIVPSNLRKQWNQELLEKFFINSIILETKSFNQLVKEGKRNPFDQKQIVICSYHFVRSKAESLRLISWDLIVIDEAHRLRNVYKTTNKIARAIKEAILPYPKVLMTATPLQNTLLELYGLVSFVDEYTFGDLKSFKSQYSRLKDENDDFFELKERLAPLCKRTLRRQVLEYIKYTNRIPLTQSFIPTKNEEVLYDLVSEYLRHPQLFALPSSQRHLMILILRKLLASSTFAIAGTLNSLVNRLNGQLKKAVKKRNLLDELSDDFETTEEISDEWEEQVDEEEEILTEDQIEALKNEIKDLEAFRDLAESITHNAKGTALISALKTAFKKASEIGAKEKAIIFTESRRTQQYLYDLLEANGYKDKIVLFNGTNNDNKSKVIYNNWLEKHQGTDKLTGSKTADMRSALVDYFKNAASIMLATEAAAEGINLQFCSLVVNYDLPWNPQRIEQRIGRCHRYGQKSDVVVVNFLNQRNAADQRVLQLLEEKFRLFSGVFGASDEILGSIESGVDFEKRIVQIYQNCRTHEEIQRAFDELQKELEDNISQNIQNTRQKLLEHFDEEVHEKLRVNLKEATQYLNKYEALLWQLTRYYLKHYAEFEDGQAAFSLKRNPFTSDQIPLGLYKMEKDIENAHIYRIGHPLAKIIIQKAKQKPLQNAKLIFHYTGYPKISILEPLINKSGILSVYNLIIESFEQEDHLILCGIIDSKKQLDQDQCSRLFSLPADIEIISSINERLNKDIEELFEKNKNKIVDNVALRNNTFFENEIDKIDKWADDKRKSLKITMKELEENIKETKKQSRLSSNLAEKVSLQKKIKNLEKKYNEVWRDFETASQEIEKKKDTLIDQVEARLKQTLKVEKLFSITWELK